MMLLIRSCGKHKQLEIYRADSWRFLCLLVTKGARDSGPVLFKFLLHFCFYRFEHTNAKRVLSRGS